MRDVSLQAGGDTLTLRFSFNAICTIEEKTGGNIAEVLNFGDGETPPMRLVRTLVWAGLQHHNPMNEEEAGDVIDLAGIEATMQAVEKALAAAFPDGKQAGNAQKGGKSQTG